MSEDEVNELVVTIHGVEYDRKWQERVGPELGGIDGLVYDPHIYGRFQFWKVLFEPFRQKEIDAFNQKISDFQARHPLVKPSVIAHSFGTYIVSRALVIYPAIKLNRLILCGSIVERNYDWATLLVDRVAKVRNEVAGRDRVVKLFRWRLMRRLVPHAGPSGIDQFEQKIEEQVFNGYRHSSHFVATIHCRLFWIPFLRGTLEFRELCERCANESHPDRDLAVKQFIDLYDSAIKEAVRRAFSAKRVTARQLSDYLTLVRREIILDGAKGRRKCDELIYRHTLALLKNLKDVT